MVGHLEFGSESLGQLLGFVRSDMAMAAACMYDGRCTRLGLCLLLLLLSVASCVACVGVFVAAMDVVLVKVL